MSRLTRWTRATARLPAEAIVLVIRLYQLTLSRFLGGQCRFEPSCSRYFILALRTRGALVGTALGVWRLLRCHPLARGGYDPVPPRRR